MIIPIEDLIGDVVDRTNRGKSVTTIFMRSGRHLEIWDSPTGHTVLAVGPTRLGPPVTKSLSSGP
jgi:hypothetical protein